MGDFGESINIITSNSKLLNVYDCNNLCTVHTSLEYSLEHRKPDGRGERDGIA